MFSHEGMMWGIGGWWMMIVWIIIIIGLVFLVKWLFEQGRKDKKMTTSEESPLDILKKRYAKGEIGKEEFEQRKKDLTSS